MSKPDTPFPKHWLYYIALKILLIAGAVLFRPASIRLREWRTDQLREQAEAELSRLLAEQLDGVETVTARR